MHTHTQTAETVLQPTFFNTDHVTRVNNFTGSDMTVDTYYLAENQTLGYQRDTARDQILFIIQGAGRAYLDNGSEQNVAVTSGSVVYVPSGIWYRCCASEGDNMVICQARPAGSSSEMRLQ